ncbi:MAG: hypothetical protein HKN13_10705 [Rhodothermales bacterium]|nr:hypothetical protein [Rhodothermales bacterium]
MGKALMVLVAGFVVASAFYSTSRTDSVNDSSAKISDHQYEVLAREAALKGYEVAKQELASDFSGGQLTGSFEGGSYSTTIAVNGSTASIASMGTMTGSGGEPIEYTVQAEYEHLSSALPLNPPSFMDYALLADEDLELGGRILTEVLVTGDDGAELNADMHTNGDLRISGNKVSVQGFGTYVGSGHASPSGALQGSFQPNHNPTEGATAIRTSAVDLPTFNMSQYLAKVEADQTNLGAVLSGSYELGTRENPFVWHIDGDLTTLGNTTIDGYAIFLVDGNIDLTGNVVVGDSGYEGADESSTAFYASGDIELGGNTKFYGQFYANGNLRLHGTPRIYGSLTTAGVATLSGTPKIYYRKASPGLTTIWQDREDISRLVAYSEW